MKHPLLAGACLCSVWSGIASNAFGGIVLQYTTAAAGANPTLASDVSNPGIAEDLLSAGSGLAAASGSTWNWRSWDGPTNFADAVSGGNFWTWGFDITGAGTTVDLTDMDIRVDRSATGPDDFQIQASVNAGAPVVVLAHDFNGADSGISFTNVDLSSVGTVGTGDSLVFTLAGFNASGSTGTFDLESISGPGYGLQVRGTIAQAVPEASESLVALLGFAGLLAARRRPRRERA